METETKGVCQQCFGSNKDCLRCKGTGKDPLFTEKEVKGQEERVRKSREEKK